MTSKVDIARKVARRVYAMRKFELLGKTTRDYRDNASSVKVKFQKVQGNVFSFTAGSKDYAIKVELEDVSDVESEVKLSCSCPAWTYQGPEYHAKTNGYLLGRPKGSASRPEVRDAKGDHFLCKHAVAVLRKLDRHLPTQGS